VKPETPITTNQQLALPISPKPSGVLSSFVRRDDFSLAIKAANDEGFKGVEKNRRSPDAIGPEGTGQSVARHGSAG
jgi:hypothetical protein